MLPIGNYNPHAPVILGEEWAPIRDEQLVYTPFVNSVERGTTYLQANSGRVQGARFYLSKPQAPLVLYHVGQVNIYPAGAEDETGPIRQVVIPVSSVTVTGTNISLGGTAASYTAALYQPGDNQYASFAYNSGNLQSLSAWFAVDQYPELANKRILNVSLLYAGNASDVENVTGRRISFINPSAGSQSMTVVLQVNDLGSGQTFLGKTFSANTGALTDLSSDVNPVTSNPATNQTIATLNLGDINNCWNTADMTGSEKLPWRYVDLLRLQQTYGAGRQQIQIQVVIPLTSGGVTGAGTSVVMNLDYLALQVTYCEEKRIAYGGQQYSYAYLGANGVTLRDLNQAANPLLPAGLYLPTLTFVSMGQVGFGGTTQGAFPELNAVRELYQIPSHVGVDVDVPFPLSDHLGDTFTSTTTHILPQLSLHVSGDGAPLTEPHAYGRQAAARVYGTNTATQGIYDAISGAAASYPQVRFYARRFGDTTVPLSLSSVFSSALSLPGTSGNYASTPDNAVLDITGDIDISADLSLTDWTPAAEGAIVTKWAQPANLSYFFGLSAGGLLEFFWTTGGTNATVTFIMSTAAVPISSGRLSVRATMDVNNGAGGNTVTFYTAPTSAGPWSQLGNPVVTAGVTTLFSGSAPVEVGSLNGGTGTLLTGATIYSAQILNGIGGTAVANPDFAAQTPGTTSFTDAAGRTWSINGTAAIAGNSAQAGVSASITPQDFDELAEILDGWREVTLRFGTAASLGTSTVPAAFRWSAPGETAGNRWEVMAASAPSLSGIPGNNFNSVSAPSRLGPATYQPELGSSAMLTWMPQGVASQWVTGATIDQATDATLILSQDPATVTGVALTARTQVVSGVGLDCGSLACCIPTGIAYQQVSWSLPVNTVLLSDDFTRTAASGLGSADVGGAWTVVAPTAQYAVDGDSALITPIAAGTPAIATLSGARNFEASVQTGLTGIPASGATGRVSLIGRYSSTSNYYEAYLESDANGVTSLVLQAIVGGVTVASTTSQAVPYTIASGARVNLRLMVADTPAGATIKAKAWVLTDPEPPTWLAELNVTGANVLAGTDIGIAARAGAATGIVADFDSFDVGPPSYWFGALELQRWDNQADDFQTIMLATDPGVTSFNDYEARVGITSVYRIRNLNSLNFAGSWSTYVSGAPPEPGVTGGCSDQTGALIFTSNADQTGANNAAYAMQWSGAPTEDFALPEADMVVFQPMYRRDGSVAFHGTERGLETFERDVLLHAAAIDPVRLADATTIRDLAWADLPYVCVRDERGDRWLANVRVPTVAARNNATRYMARLKIVETTQTPYPVDPS